MKKIPIASGHILIYAIVLLIVILSISGLVLMSVGYNTRIYNSINHENIGEIYVYQGFEMLDDEDLITGVPYQYHLDNGYILNLIRKEWGGYDIYYSTLTNFNHDTVFNRIGLVGFGKNISDKTALHLANTGSPLYLSENSRIVGHCYVSKADIRPYLHFDSENLPDSVLLSDDDNLPMLKNIDYISDWKNSFRNEIQENTYFYRDSISVSFSEPTKVITGNSITITGCIKGNVVVSANTVLFAPGAVFEDIIVVANKVFIQNGILGNCQVFAEDSIVAEPGIKLTYPTLLVLLPKRKDEVINPAIITKGVSNIHGEFYAYSKEEEVNSRMRIRGKDRMYISGGIFSSSDIIWTGECNGSIVCRTIMDNVNNQSNLINESVINIDTLPKFYTYSKFYPFGREKKIVKWLK